MKTAWLCLPLAVFVGCGGGASKTDTPPPPPDPTAPRTVTGTSQADYFQESGSASHATDLSGFTVKALVPDGAGGYKSFSGTGLADGTFSIPNVPPGACFIQLYKAGGYASHVWTDLSQIHFGGYGQGRTDWTAAAVGTTLEIQPTVAPAAGTYGELIVPSLGILRGAYFTTSSNAWRFGFGGGPLPEQGKDSGFFTYNTPGVAVGTEGIQTLAGVLSLPAGGLQAGATTTLQVAPQSLSADASLDIALDAGAFASAVSEIATTNNPRDLTCTLKIQPYGAKVAPLSVASTLLTYQTPVTSGIVQKSGLPYADPFPSKWGKVIVAQRSVSKSYTPPGETLRVTFLFSTSVYYPQSALPSQPLAPLISPVRNLKVNGQSVSLSNLSVGLTPLFTWDAPAVGTPAFYSLTLYQVSVRPGPTPGSTSSSSTAIANFRTPLNHLQVPADLLVKGNAYLAVVTASTGGGNYEPAHPMRFGFPLGTADYNTELFIP